MAKKKKNSNIASLISYKKKKNDTPSRISRTTILYTLLAIIFLAAIGSGVWYFLNTDVTDMAITLAGDGSETLKTGEKKQIEQMIRKSLTKDYQSQDSIAAAIQNQTQAGSVSILRTGFNSILVKIEARRALFKVVVDKPRLLSVNGQIYGLAKDEPNSPLITVSGLLDDERRKLTFASDQTLILTPAEEARIADLMQLYRVLNEANLPVTAIGHIPYRGFEIKLTKDETRIVIGKDQFYEKIQRLADILQKLSEQNKHAESIELDYKGKAFIKEKKI